ncbi:hypothetical protein [Streptomyces clavuligerus]|uniref:hypothetical protein n=1 Tax=Streptomyces clavuligerus TaxID=1901 RepID=UPI00020D90CA|nr:hypothetical protein [Streptomyces clavuligerus]ANW19712.1 hypothetical protein BB341_16535 [Streptomyces clavuligerus]MBY6304329.1 hypothetical protein [Streptomyces clavuligerus]QPL64354.1 hypothetical protein I3J04_16750 [Streptomyces clavuligerus]QPL70382.1 hypothetical protein I3J05_16760 [Streptomyces clavuligerus]QPL76466.1 hypothetical protein I3J06_16765 [Streptomyces clavuligerus]
MGSLRNPIGPLPSSIYWRRRAVALALVALLALLAAWAFTRGGGDGDKADSANGASKPVPSTIGPGPSQSGPAISTQPGGRDEPGGPGPGSGPSPGSGSGSGGGTGGSGGAGTGSGADGSGAGGTGADTGSGSGSANGGSGTGTGSGPGTGSGTGSGALRVAPAGERVPAGSPLPACPAGALKVAPELRNDFAPGVRPEFVLNVTNLSKETCKADVGPRAAVFTITDADGAVWSSKDCPDARDRAVLRVPAGTTVSHTVTWDRTRSEPKCATPRAGAVPAGTYVVELEYPGKPAWERSFVLKKD